MEAGVAVEVAAVLPVAVAEAVVGVVAVAVAEVAAVAGLALAEAAEVDLPAQPRRSQMFKKPAAGARPDKVHRTL